MDARGGSNEAGDDDGIPPEQGGSRLTHGRDAGRGTSGGSDPLLMAVPRASGNSNLIGASTPGAIPADLDPGAAFADWTDAGPGAATPSICKFLRSIGPDGKLFDPRSDAIPTHRCAAFGDPLPLSLRQQELVCLQRVHVSCPRYMRGTLLADESATAAVQDQPRSGMPYMTIAGLALVAVAGVAAIAIMMGFLPGISNGGGNPTGAGSPIAAITASPTAPSSLAPTATPTSSATATAGTPTTTPTPTASPIPTLSPTPTPTSKPVASPTWPPGATASRMNLVVPCPDQASCYIYTIRGPGPSGNGSKVADTVPGVARFFGVSVNSVYAMNPGSASGVQPGDKLKIPPPTR